MLSITSITRVWRRACTSNTNRIETCFNGEILPFANYAACRLLQIPLSLEPKSKVYKALMELAKDYLRADLDAITKCIARYGLDILLGDSYNPNDKSIHKIPLVRDLLFLLEALLLEYLSQNWDAIDKVFQINHDQSMNRAPSQGLLSNGADPVSYRARRNWQKAYRLVIRKIVVETLGVQRKFLTLAQMFTRVHGSPSKSDLQEKQELSRRNRGPILLLLGGGMAAGKSTVGQDAVVIEADAIKNQDVVYQALKERLGDDPALSELVHEFSTSRAEYMLVTAINEQKDIVFDGTMTWLPFVKETIEMARDHTHHYKRGPGYHHDALGAIHEHYWEVDETVKIKEGSKLPYRIELVGVTCDPALAVARGIWRKIRTGRGVSISSQLRSHRLFSQNFNEMAKLVDSVTLYHTGSNLTTFSHSSSDIKSPKVICHASSVTRGELLVNPKAMEEFRKIKLLNDSAKSVQYLYGGNALPSKDKELLERTLTNRLNAIHKKDLRDSLVRAHREGLTYKESEDSKESSLNQP
eukprot:g6858.t1